MCWRVASTVCEGDQGDSGGLHEGQMPQHPPLYLSCSRRSGLQLQVPWGPPFRGFRLERELLLSVEEGSPTFLLSPMCRIGSSLLGTFFRCVVESIFSTSIKVWHSSTKKALQRTVKAAQNIVRNSLQTTTNKFNSDAEKCRAVGFDSCLQPSFVQLTCLAMLVWVFPGYFGFHSHPQNLNVSLRTQNDPEMGRRRYT